MRVTPKIRLSPDATMKRAPALASPVNSCAMNSPIIPPSQAGVEKEKQPPQCRGCWVWRGSVGLRAQGAHHLVRWQIVGAIFIGPIHHHAFAILHRGAAHIGAHGGLMINR